MSAKTAAAGMGLARAMQKPSLGKSVARHAFGTAAARQPRAISPLLELVKGTQKITYNPLKSMPNIIREVNAYAPFGSAGRVPMDLLLDDAEQI
jgi:hypothetical protein